MVFLLFLVGVGGFLLLLSAWLLYEHYLHPSWRKERRVLRACEQAFETGTYLLIRLRLNPDAPSGADLLSLLPGSSKSPRYFTYNIECRQDAEPDYSGMSETDIGLIRHYLNRGADVPHYGRTVLRPRKEANSTVFTEQNDPKDNFRDPNVPARS